MTSTNKTLKTTLKDRLAKGAALLDRIARTRDESHNPQFGENTERLLLTEHLSELEAEIARDPGALSSFFEGAQHG
jgi:hypothetical protein